MNLESRIGNTNRLLDELVQVLDIPDGYYEKAVDRYKSMSDHFHRPESQLASLDPTIYPQGSFRLGTVIRPLFPDDGYDLDLVCRICGRKTTSSQKDIKTLVGIEVKSYSQKQCFKLPPEEGKRCWTQQYQDEVDFHMDVLPAIPNEPSVRLLLENAGVERSIAMEALAITDRTLPNYAFVDPNWPRSNPKGYAMWFDARMDVAGGASMIKHAIFEEHRTIYAAADEVPAYRVKSPLQRSVQLLKRHRDQMFREDPDGKPISIIITTLAALAYGGETDPASALAGILSGMGDFVLNSKPRIANPVDPEEDFADRWNQRLEDNFWRWLRQAQEDFGRMGSLVSKPQLETQIRRSFDLALPESTIAALAAGPIAAPNIVTSSSRPTIEIKDDAAPSWAN